MPQLSITDPPDVQLVLELHDHTRSLQPGIRVTVRLATEDERPSTFWVGELVQEETDYLGTLIERIAEAWLYSDRRTLLRQAVTTHRQAKAHRRRHQYR